MERNTNALTRRDFLQASAGAGAYAVSADLAGGAIQRPATSPMPGDALTGWFDRPMRWAQLTLVENDPGRFDPDFWLDYFARIRADAACLSAGGIVAYYPTELPLHHRSAVARRHRSVRHARHRMPAIEDARDRADRSARRA